MTIETLRMTSAAAAGALMLCLAPAVQAQQTCLEFLRATVADCNDDDKAAAMDETMQRLCGAMGDADDEEEEREAARTGLLEAAAAAEKEEVEAERPREAACRVVMESVLASLLPPVPVPDRHLALLAASPPRTTDANASGTPAQLDPVADVTPIPLVGGAIAITGERGGPRLVGTASLNPWALFESVPEDEAAAAWIEAQRTMDLSVAVPFDNWSGGDDAVDLVSVRFRVNLAPAFEPKALEAVGSAVDEYAQRRGKLGDALLPLLLKAADAGACARGLVTDSFGACASADGPAPPGSPTDLVEAVREAQHKAIEAVAAAREEADDWYFGLDLRADFGDPSGDEVANDEGYFFNGGLAAGVRLAQHVELRARAAVDYRALTDPPGGDDMAGVTSAEWGLGFVFDWVLGDVTSKKWLGLGVGAIARHTSEDATDIPGPAAGDLSVDTNFVDLRFMISVPVADQGNLGLSITWPVWVADASGHPDATTFALTGDWGLLGL